MPAAPTQYHGMVEPKYPQILAARERYSGNNLTRRFLAGLRAAAGSSCSARHRLVLALARMLRILSIYPSLSACRSAKQACSIARFGYPGPGVSKHALQGTLLQAARTASNVECARQQTAFARVERCRAMALDWLAGDGPCLASGWRPRWGDPRPKTNQPGLGLLFVEASSNTPPTRFKLFLLLAAAGILLDLASWLL